MSREILLLVDVPVSYTHLDVYKRQNLGGGDRDLRSHQALQHLNDLARGYALDVHFGQGQIDRLLSARALVQC